MTQRIQIFGTELCCLLASTIKQNT